eukprot:8426808-Pyramimonas_sp.AAC.1
MSGSDEPPNVQREATAVGPKICLRTSNECYELLQNGQAESFLFDGFTLYELKILAELFSILQIQPGEEVMRHGEESTFFGVVLDGSFDVTVEGRLAGTLMPGDVVGQLALFTGDRRTATGTVSNEGPLTLAAIPYNEIPNIWK